MCVKGFDIHIDRNEGKKEGMYVPHRFLPPAHVMWLGLVPQLLPWEGVKRRKRGGCWWMRGWIEEKCECLCIYCWFKCSVFHDIDFRLVFIIGIQELEGFWLKSQLWIKNLWAWGSRTFPEQCRGALVQGTDSPNTQSSYPGLFIHSDTSPSIAWVVWV